MSVVYLYGFVPAELELPEAGLLGIDDAPVERLVEGPVAAVISRLDGEAYQPEELERRAGDVEWVARQGLRHEEVVAWFVDHGVILPSPLLNVFSGEAPVRAALRERGDELEGELDRFRDLREWDLRMEVDEARLGGRLAEVSEPIAELEREMAAASPGKRFLLEKRQRELTRTEVRSAARRFTRELVDEVRSLSVRTRTLMASADDAETTAVVAFLVARSRESEVERQVAAAAARLEPLGVEVRLTGPWAPYRFMGDD